MWQEITEDDNFERSEGLDLIWQLRADPGNIVISSVDAELENMVYYHSEYRWPAVIGAGGSIAVTVPRAGRFVPAVVVYDSPGRQVYELLVDGTHVGAFLAVEDDNRQRLHFLSRAIDFSGGEKLTFRLGSEAQHITEDILLLARRPPAKERKFEISHVEAACVRLDSAEHLRLTWITTWPARCAVEYGATTAYTDAIAEEEPVANHRVYLPDLSPGSVLHYRIVAPRARGEDVVTGDHTASFAPPPPLPDRLNA